MNIFKAVDNLRETYHRYVFTFQKFRNPEIRKWVEDKMSEGGLLWKDTHVELRRRYVSEINIQELADSGLLHPKTPDIFSGEKGPLDLYKHQEEAIQTVLEGQNVIITTGTGSGKSFCFGIPIISECLKLKEQNIGGIKAILVYPMNALANSQYDEFSKRLAGSGLRLGLYTGDTPTDPDTALGFHNDAFGREPFDCEVLSRTEIQEDPPDILMTNYVMLELLMTRFEDKKLLPDRDSNLKFLVLDEIHTYSGQRGADVACLVRRLKERTGTTGSLRCIGTSATVQGGESQKEEDLISEFAADIFGESVSQKAVIKESLLTLAFPDPIPLTEEISITNEMIEEFDGSIGSAVNFNL